jgi:hypothetical protein
MGNRLDRLANFTHPARRSALMTPGKAYITKSDLSALLR